MTKFNTLVRLTCTLTVCLLFSQASFAQTVLNFGKVTVNDRLNAGFAVINPTTNYADVQFTYYGLDGNPAAPGLVNPVRYRVAPKGQISMLATELFAGSGLDGWVQVTSTTTGLSGHYLLGDFATRLEGSEPAASMAVQVVPLIREDQRNRSELIVLNPGTANVNLTITLHNSRGEELASTVRSMDGHAALRLRTTALIANPPADNLSARISASAPIAAMSVIERGDAFLFAPGQPVDEQAVLRIAPHFIAGNGFDPTLVLKNPGGSPVSATVTLFGENGGAPLPGLGGPASRTVSIPANGSVALTTVDITGRFVLAPSINGWLRIDSANVALNGLLILDEGHSVTAVPLQTTSLSRSLFANIDEAAAAVTGLSFMNPSSATAVVDVFIVRGNGATLAQNTVNVPPRSKLSALVSNLFPEVTGRKGDYIFVRSSESVYSICMIGASTFLATIPAARVAASFGPNPIRPTPTILEVEPGLEVRAGTTLRVAVTGVDDVSFSLGGQAVGSRQVAPGIPSFYLDLPAIEPGYVSLAVRSNGVDSDPVVLHILPFENSTTQKISGRGFYQKIDLRDSGLDPANPIMVPIRNARVELINTVSQSIVAVSETDALGRFIMPVPADPNLVIRVVSRLRSSTLRVLDNTNSNAIYSAVTTLDGRTPPPEILLTETSRISGAFNIIEMIQRANETAQLADPRFSPPPVTVFWSTRNTNRFGNPAAGLVGTSTFNVATNAAYILGDRTTDSDEFDDPVIIHEYAHMLAARFSRDDSPGGIHRLGDMLDPRVAWSEGWANFFSSAVRNDPTWRDSGANGALIVRYDLEINVPESDTPGYWSEASVATLLWDMFDDREDVADDVQYPWSDIWNAFTDLRNDRFVYLPYFFDHFLARRPTAADALRIMVQSRSIDFQPNVRPSVTNPFPTPVNVGTVVAGLVDSATTKRTNLIGSAHFYSFTTTGGAASIRLDITGLGPGRNPNTNDLDLFLMDVNGRVIARSDNGLNGQAERVALRIPADTYVIEIRSFYTNAETGGIVFNSGDYRLSVSVQ